MTYLLLPAVNIDIHYWKIEFYKKERKWSTRIPFVIDVPLVFTYNYIKWWWWKHGLSCLRRTNNRRHMSVVQVCVLYKYMLTEEKYDNFFLSIFFYKPITPWMQLFFTNFFIIFWGNKLLLVDNISKLSRKLTTIIIFIIHQ